MRLIIFEIFIGSSDVCYLVRYETGQFELVLNTVAHKYCPLVIHLNY